MPLVLQHTGGTVQYHPEEEANLRNKKWGRSEVEPTLHPSVRRIIDGTDVTSDTTSMMFDVG